MQTVKINKNKKIVKNIRVDVDKCNGCRACEVICSAFHASPRYSSNNPAKSRIRVVHDAVADIFVPIYAGEYTMAECAGRDKYVIDGKEYEECAFCRASCPSRDLFKEPDSGLPVKCDMCESDPDLETPMCVKWCITDALVYEEREEDLDEEVEEFELETGLEALANKFGIDKVNDILTQLNKAKKG